MKKSKAVFVEVRGAKLKPTVFVGGEKTKQTSKERNALAKEIGKLIKQIRKHRKGILDSKVMYRVEKFLPQECPKCRHKFDKIGVDWTPLRGDIVNGKKVIRKTNYYYIIICSRCQNFTASIPLESYMLSDPEAARKLLKQGFVNFHKVKEFGNTDKDLHMVYTKFPYLCEAIKRK